MKSLDRHNCGACGFGSPRWFGRCPECGSWNSAQLQGDGIEPVAPRSLDSVEAPSERLMTGIDDVDRAFGEGIVRGSAVLLAGEPGVGKSTLLLQIIAGVAGTGRRCLLVTAEESLEQVAQRAQRLSISDREIHALSTTQLPEVLAASRASSADLVVVDSVQAIQDPTFEQGPGATIQVRECASALVQHAKSTSTAVILVGHVTKDGSVAGPKTLEHMVDTVLSLDGERSGALRLFRALKNRFGSCEETGIFTMTASGLKVVEDPSAMLLEDRVPGISGSLVFPMLQGSRVLLVEVQALVNENDRNIPSKRVALGLEARRLSLLLGVLENRAELKLGAHEVFVAAPGGVSVKEPAADLAICLALHSSKENVAIDEGIVAVGEVGLGGEIRRVPNVSRRLVEAARLGFRRAIVPPRSAVDDLGIEAIEVNDLAAAFRAVDKLSRVRAA